MRTIYEQSLAALFAAAFAFGCGSDKQQQQAKEPSSASTDTSSLQTTGATEYGQYGGGMQPTMPSTPSTATTPAQPPTAGGPQDTTAGAPAGSQNAEPSSTTTTTPATMDSKVTNLSDGEVFAIESALNKGEISLAELARKHAVTADVKSFAGMMLTHHRDAQNKASAVARKEKLVASEDDVSKKLQMDVSTMTEDLQKRKGRDFDSAYIDSQVRMHRDAGSLIDSQLLPSVKSAALKDELTNLRQTISSHLTRAEEIQSHMEVVGSTSTTSGTTTPGGTKAKGAGTTHPKEPATPKEQTEPKDQKEQKEPVLKR